MGPFKKAVKHDAKLRLALCGPSGSGKTYTALSIASGLGGPIAHVDTEHGSASKYADIFEFDVLEPTEFDPRRLIETIGDAVNAGYRVFIVDSLSHYWMGKGGELEMVDSAAKRNQGNSFAAWKHVTPVHNQLIDTIISAPLHIIATLRTKTEWVVEKDDKGKSVPRKIGIAPIMRDGIEYEFDVCGDLDQDNTLTVSKSRCPALAGKVINQPGKQMAEDLKRWLSSGVPAPVIRQLPEELSGFASTAAAFEYLQSELIKTSGSVGEGIYLSISKELRERFPKGTRIPETAIHDTLLKLWDQLEISRKEQAENGAAIQNRRGPAVVRTIQSCAHRSVG